MKGVVVHAAKGDGRIASLPPPRPYFSLPVVKVAHWVPTQVAANHLVHGRGAAEWCERAVIQ